ncbi:snoRNA-binding rRNA-processing protein [Phytophthora boehmeriae]|uniref:SnoRNA-binding rRNA-processing protein n=1 Tax=Phytophthora boehmeriae TaxID=109152 RepID=A0A8T1X0R3_9STRA|nr:snoRNA-binding rRNA-processing protein [Phytophthora boehmeriae]
MAKLTVAGGLMILVNIGFLIAGILLLQFKSTLESSGWADALTDTEYESAANAAITMVMLLGVVAITMAIVGIVGAIIQNRLLLLLYSVIMVAAMSAFGVLAGTAFTFKTKMTDWENAAFPAEDQETKLAETFNSVYCYAEGYYYCNNATAQEAYETFFPNASTTIVSLLPNVTGITSVCSELQGTVDGLSTVCDACNMSTTFARYDKILMWAESKCPRTSTTGAWCASFLATGTAGEVYTGSPYGQCRTIFLDVAIDWSGTMVIAGLLSAIAAAAIVAMACFARRSKSSEDDRMTKV